MTDPAPGSGTSAADPVRPPAPLVVALGLASVEAGLLVLLGVAELLAVEGQRLTMGVSTALFFLMYGGGLAFCVWSGYRLQHWARAPLVLAQLIQLGVAYSFWGGSSVPAAAALAVVALVALAGILHPASLRAFGDGPV